MALFKWYKIYSVNNNELDEQHKTIHSIFNNLYGNCLHRENAYCIDTILEELIAYSYYHFSVEEKIMRNIDIRKLINIYQSIRSFHIKHYNSNSQSIKMCRGIQKR
jgi:hemerythrin-like metal-binding protein